MFGASLDAIVGGGRMDRDVIAVNRMVHQLREHIAETDPERKADALYKLVYMHMLGYDGADLAFHVVEVMSQPWIQHRKTALQAAAQLFTPETDVLLLCTHMFKKWLSAATGMFSQNKGTNKFLKSYSISCLACVCNESLAMALLDDVWTMIGSSDAMIIRRAVMLLLRMFEQWPQALLLSYDRLRNLLNHSDAGVVCSAVSVFCELAAKNPHNYRALAPMMLQVLKTTSSSNVWLLIKSIKTLGFLTAAEPLVGDKSLATLTQLLQTHQCASVKVECLQTIIKCLPNVSRARETVTITMDAISELIDSRDYNIRFQGIIVLRSLLETVNGNSSDASIDKVFSCLERDDFTTRVACLEVIIRMMSRTNLPQILMQVLAHLRSCDGHQQYLDMVIEMVLSHVALDKFALVDDFKWYFAFVAAGFGSMESLSVKSAHLIAEQLIQIVLKVHALRPFAVNTMAEMLLHRRFESVAKEGMCEMLAAGVFIVAEFCNFSSNGDPDESRSALDDIDLSQLVALCRELTSDRLIRGTNSLVHSRIAQNVLKIVLVIFRPSLLEESKADWLSLCNDVTAGLQHLLAHDDVEVQERALLVLPVVNRAKECLAASDFDDEGSQSKRGLLELLASAREIFATTLTSVHAKAQSKVQAEVDLTVWIHDPVLESDEEPEDNLFMFDETNGAVTSSSNIGQLVSSGKEYSPDELEVLQEKQRVEESMRKASPFILSSTSESRRQDEDDPSAIEGVASDPIVVSYVNTPQLVIGSKSSAIPLPGMTSFKKNSSLKFDVCSDDEMPEGAEISDDEGSPGQDSRKTLADLELSQLHKSTKHRDPKPSVEVNMQPTEVEVCTDRKYLAQLGFSRKFVCADDIIQVKYDVSAKSPSSPNGAQVVIRFAVRFCPKGEEWLRAVKFRLDCVPSSLCLVENHLVNGHDPNEAPHIVPRSDSSSTEGSSLILVLAEKQKRTGTFYSTAVFECEEFIAPLELSGDLEYILRGQSRSSTSKHMQCSLSLESSACVYPVVMTMSELKVLLHDGVSCTFSADCCIQKSRFECCKAAPSVIAHILGVKSIRSKGDLSTFAGAASCKADAEDNDGYGHDIPVRLAVLFTRTGSHSCRVVIKSGRQQISDTLVRQVVNVLSE